MQAFVATLTAALLFIHTVFGCCWHHAQCSTVAVSQSEHCCHHHKQSGDSNHQEKPCKCNIECEGSCAYVVPQKVKIEAPQWTSIEILAVLPSLAERPIEAACSSEDVSSLRAWVPPLRTHLLHQVLLN
jgi:hypothetical protein